MPAIGLNAGPGAGVAGGEGGGTEGATLASGESGALEGVAMLVGAMPDVTGPIGTPLVVDGVGSTFAGLAADTGVDAETIGALRMPGGTVFELLNGALIEGVGEAGGAVGVVETDAAAGALTGAGVPTIGDVEDDGSEEGATPPAFKKLPLTYRSIIWLILRRSAAIFPRRS